MNDGEYHPNAGVLVDLTPLDSTPRKHGLR